MKYTPPGGAAVPTPGVRTMSPHLGPMRPGGPRHNPALADPRRPQPPTMVPAPPGGRPPYVGPPVDPGYDIGPQYPPGQAPWDNQPIPPGDTYDPNPLPQPGGPIFQPMPIGVQPPRSGLIDRTPYPIGEDGQNIYPQPGDPGYTGPRPGGGIMPIQPMPSRPIPMPPPRFDYPVEPPSIMPVDPRRYPQPGRGQPPRWGGRWGRRSPFGGRGGGYYPALPGRGEIPFGNGLLQTTGTAPADPLQTLLTRLQGGG